MSDDDVMSAVQEWAAEVGQQLHLDADVLDLDAVLGVAGMAARTIVRPAAPVTTYLVGYAVGRATATGEPVEAAFADAVAIVRALVARHAADQDSA